VLLDGFGGMQAATLSAPKPFAALRHGSTAGRRSFRPRRGR
jgi:hypothetical protein